VEVILFQNGVPSMTPPQFYPWPRVVLLGGSVAVGIVIAGILIALRRLILSF
jgi:hypothetical protein